MYAIDVFVDGVWLRRPGRYASGRDAAKAIKALRRSVANEMRYLRIPDETYSERVADLARKSE